MKKCSNKQCLSANPVFAKNRTKPDGLNNQCKECVKALYKIRYANNKPEILAKNKKYRNTNKSLMTAIKAEWRRRNRVHSNEVQNTWRKLNLDKVRELDRLQASKRRALKRGAISDGSTLTDLIELNDDLTCYLCSKHIVGKIHIDHIIPLSRGGQDTIDNKALTHPFCNLSKGAKLLDGVI